MNFNIIFSICIFYVLINVFEASHHKHHRKNHHVKKQKIQLNKDHETKHKINHLNKGNLTQPQNASRRDHLGFLNTFHKDKATFNKLFAQKINKTLNDNTENDDEIISIVQGFGAKNAPKFKKHKHIKKVKKFQPTDLEEENDMGDLNEDEDEEDTSKEKEKVKQIRKSKHKHNVKNKKKLNKKVKQKRTKQKIQQNQQEIQQHQLNKEPQTITKTTNAQKQIQIQNIKNVVKKTQESIKLSKDKEASEEYQQDDTQTGLFDLQDDGINVERKHSPLIPDYKNNINKGTKLDIKFPDFNLEGLTKDLDKTLLDATGSGSGDINTGGSANGEKEMVSSGENLLRQTKLINKKAKKLPPVSPQSSISTDQADKAQSNAAGTYPNFPIPPMIPIPLFYNSGEEESSTAASGMTDVKPSKDLLGGESGLGETATPTVKTEGTSGDWADQVLADQRNNSDDDDDDDEELDEDEAEEKKHALKLEALAKFPPQQQQNGKPITTQQMVGLPQYPSVYQYPAFRPLTYYEALAKRLALQKQYAAQLMKEKMASNLCSQGCDPLCSPSCNPICCKSRAEVSKFNDKDIAHSAAIEAKTEMKALELAINSGKQPASLKPPGIGKPVQVTLSNANVYPNQNLGAPKQPELSTQQAQMQPAVQQAQTQPAVQQSQMKPAVQQEQSQAQQQQQQAQQITQLPILGLFQAAQQQFQAAIQNQQMVNPNQQQQFQSSNQLPVQQQTASYQPQYNTPVEQTQVQAVAPLIQATPQQSVAGANNYGVSANRASTETPENHREEKVDHDLETAIDNLPQGNLVPLPDMMIDSSNPSASAEFKSGGSSEQVDQHPKTDSLMNSYTTENQNTASQLPQDQALYTAPLGATSETEAEQTQQEHMKAAQKAELEYQQSEHQKLQQSDKVYGAQQQGASLHEVEEVQEYHNDGKNTENQAQSQDTSALQYPTPQQQETTTSTTQQQYTTTENVGHAESLGPASSNIVNHDYMNNIQTPLTQQNVLEAKDDVANKPITYPNPLINIPGRVGNFAFKPVQPVILKMQPIPVALNKNTYPDINNNNNCNRACERSCLPYCTNYCCGIGNRRHFIAKHKSS